MELVPEFCPARWFSRRLPWRDHLANGSPLGPPQIRKTRPLDCRKAGKSRGGFVKPLLVDLETAWRGGQNQALLLLKGLRDRGHQPELVAATNSALGQRAAAAGIPVHYVSRGFFRLAAALKIRQLLASSRFDLVHANEAHAVSAAWLAGTHKRAPFVIWRRVGYPI